MKHGLGILLAGVLVLGLSGCASKPVEADLGVDGVQSAKVIVQHGYKPNHIVAKAGKPLKVEFYRDEEGGGHSCGEELVIPSENIKIKLPARESQIVEIKAQPAGELVFTCGMNMLKGTITFE